jgi:virulence factor
MLKVGIIGLGDIAAKAYVPIVTRKNLEVHLCTRNANNLAKFGDEYRLQNRHRTLEALIGAGIEAAFVHTSTASHFEIVSALLENNIHVYVDKPVTYNYESTRELVALAGRKHLTFMAGFNRRYAPAYTGLKRLQSPSMILMQKNRRSLPGDVRVFVFDDFIHVLDTLLYFFPYPVEDLSVTGRKADGLLYHVVVQFRASDGTTAIGMMNRDSGTVEERLEIFTSTGKWVVSDLTETIIYRDNEVVKLRPDDWAPTLNKRGFHQIVDAFLNAVMSPASPALRHEDILRTHELCERVVRQLS